MALDLRQREHDRLGELLLTFLCGEINGHDPIGDLTQLAWDLAARLDNDDDRLVEHDRCAQLDPKLHIALVARSYRHIDRRLAELGQHLLEHALSPLAPDGIVPTAHGSMNSL